MWRNHKVGAQGTKFARELAPNVEIQIDEGGCYGCATHHRDERHGKPSTATAKQLQ
jgi:hypothetical protein